MPKLKYYPKHFLFCVSSRVRRHYEEQNEFESFSEISSEQSSYREEAKNKAIIQQNSFHPGKQINLKLNLSRCLVKDQIISEY